MGESGSVADPPSKIVDARRSVSQIRDGATAVIDGLCMMGVAELVLEEIEASFLATGHPQDLTVVHSAAPTDGLGGIERLAHVGLVKRVIGSHWGLMPKMSRLLAASELESICLPQGQLSRLFRSIAAGAPGHVSAIGLGTFVDPRLGGGRVSEPAKLLDPETFVALIDRIGGFVDITQSARRVCFCFTTRGRHQKFVESVDHLSLNAERALTSGTEVFYVCELAVLRLTHDGLAVERLAEGVSTEQLQAAVGFPLVDSPRTLVASRRKGPHLSRHAAALAL